MYCMGGLLCSYHCSDSIQGIINQFTMSAYFIPIYNFFTVERLAYIYIWENVHLHGVALSIILDRGYQSTSSFQRAFQKQFSIKVDINTTFYPHSVVNLYSRLKVVNLLGSCLLKGSKLVINELQSSFLDYKFYQNSSCFHRVQILHNNHKLFLIELMESLKKSCHI